MAFTGICRPWVVGFAAVDSGVSRFPHSQKPSTVQQEVGQEGFNRLCCKDSLDWNELLAFLELTLYEEGLLRQPIRPDAAKAVTVKTYWCFS